MSELPAFLLQRPTNFSVVATSGAQTQTIPLSLTLTRSADYMLTAGPAPGAARPGSVIAIPVAVEPLNGFSGAVSLAVTGLPAGSAAVFAPVSVTGAGTAVLTVTLAGNAASAP